MAGVMSGPRVEADAAPSGIDELLRRLGVGATAGIATMPLSLYSLPANLVKAIRPFSDPSNHEEPNAFGKAYYDSAANADKIVDNVNDAARKIAGLPTGDAGLKGDVEEFAASMLLNPTTALTRLAVKSGSKFATRASKLLSVATGTPESLAGKAAIIGVNTGLDAGIRNHVYGDQAPHNETGPDNLETPAIAQPNEESPAAPVAEAQPATFAERAKLALTVPANDFAMRAKSALAAPVDDSWLDKAKDIVQQHGAEIAAGLAVAGVLTHMVRAKSIASLTRELHADELPGLTGLNAATDVTAVPTKFSAGLLDPLNAIRPIIKKIRNGKIPEDLDTRMILSGSPSSVAARITDTLRTGEIAGSTAKLGTAEVSSLAHAADIVAKGGPEVSKLYNSGATAMNELDNIERGIPTRMPNTSIEDIKATVAAAQAHPVVSKLLAFNKAVVNGVADHWYENGIIDKATHESFKAKNYLPEVSADKKTLNTKLQDFLSGAVSDDPVTDLTSLFKREGTQGLTLPPIETLEQYITGALKFTEQNTLRRKIIRTIYGAAERGSRDYQGVLSKAEGPARRDGITIRENGVSSHFRVHDPAILTALRFTPEQVHPIFNWTRRFMQFMTTGRGAPWFSLTSAVYDAMSAAGLYPRGTKFGLFRGDVVGGTALTAGHALGAMGAQIARATGQALQTSIAADGTLVRIFGKDATSRAAKLMSNAYARSTLAMLEKFGGGGGTLASMDSEIRNGYTVLHKIAPAYASKYPKMRKLLNMYDGILESIQNGARLAFIARNAKDGMTKTQMFRLMAGTRTLTGDFSVSGASKIAKSAQSMFPYYNVTIQSMNQWAKMFKSQPFHTMLGITTGYALPTIALTYYASTLSPEHSDFFWKKMSSSQRDGYFYFPIPWLPPEKGLMIPMFPEWRPFAALIRAGMDALLGLSNGKVNDELHGGMRKGIDDFFGARDQQDLTEAVRAGLLPVGALPPALSGIIAGAGGAIDPAQMRLYEPSSLKSSPLDPTQGSIQNDVMSKSMSNFILALAGTTGGLMINAYRAGSLKYRDDNNFMSGIDAGAQSLSQDIASKVPVLNTTLLGQQIRQGRNTVDSKVFYDKANAIQKIVAGFGNDAAHPGVTGSQGRAILREGQYPTGVADPAIAQVFMLIHGISPALQKLSLPISQLQARIVDVNSDERSSPARKLELTNRLNKQLVVEQGNALDMIRELIEDPINNLTGHDIDITKLDRNSMVSDFPVLQ